MTNQLIWTGVGSACALLGLTVAGLVTAMAMAHVLDMTQVTWGTPGQNTVIKHFLEILAGICGACIHKFSTFALRYTAGYELWENRLGWIIGRNVERPSCAGVREEFLKMRHAFDSVLGKSSQHHAEEAPEKVTRASRGEDPWLKIRGRTMLWVPIGAYLLGTISAATLLYFNEVDLVSISFISIAVGTCFRGAVSIAIFALNCYIGLALMAIEAIKAFQREWKAAGAKRNAWYAACNLTAAFKAALTIVQEEKNKNKREWRLATV